MRFGAQAASAAFAAALATAPLAAAPIAATDLIVFGDSLSDVGNAYALSGGTIPPSPPYYMGQFTGPDGPVWAGIVSNAFEEQGKPAHNYAVGGAETLGSAPADLAGQFARFATDVALDSVDLGEEPLAALWFGGNDVISAVLGGKSAEEATETAESAADAVALAAASLSPLGVDDFLFFTLGDFSLVPALLGNAVADVASAAFDQRLRDNVANLRSLGFDARIVDTGGLLAAVRADPGAFGFTRLFAPCVITDPKDRSEVLQDCTGQGADASSYLWFDPVHPSSRAHAIIANAVLEEVAPIPLPATVPFAVTGFGLLLAAARRKALTRRR